MSFVYCLFIENKLRPLAKIGWNPNEDQEYLSWLEERKLNDTTTQLI